MPYSNDLQKNLDLASQAKIYAQKVIVKGSSQIQNNQLNPDYFSALTEGVDKVRDQILRGFKYSKLEKNQIVCAYEFAIKLSAKYSLGNCEEMTLQALDYLLNQVHENSLVAEEYAFTNADHVFLVIGRDQDSDPTNPLTWGKSAVICDPWDDSVFPASDYLTHLKHLLPVFNSDSKHVANKVDKVDPAIHNLAPMFNINIAYLRKARNPQTLGKVFLKRLSDVKDNVVEIKNQLDFLKFTKCSETSSLMHRLTELEKFDEQLIAMQKAFSRDLLSMDYRFVYNELQSALNKIYRKLDFVAQFSEEESKLIHLHKNAKPKGVLSNLFNFFKANITEMPTRAATNEKKKVSMNANSF